MKNCLKNVRDKSPLVHNITNYVTVNDVANALLSVGASPIMSDEKNEVQEITSICDALNINIGTLNQRTVESMIISGKKANELDHPVVLDIVGAGASSYRDDTVKKLLNEIDFRVIKGNASEIKALISGIAKSRGVDASAEDEIDPNNVGDMIEKISPFAKSNNCIIAITGAIDIVTDGTNSYLIKNGRKEMSKITGTGCQISALIAAFVASNKDPLKAAAAAIALYGLCGEIAFKKLDRYDGNSTYRNKIIDLLGIIEPIELEESSNYEFI